MWGVKHFKHMVNINCLLSNLYSRPEPILRSHKRSAERVDSHCRSFTKEEVADRNKSLPSGEAPGPFLNSLHSNSNTLAIIELIVKMGKLSYFCYSLVDKSNLGGLQIIVKAPCLEIGTLSLCSE